VGLVGYEGEQVGNVAVDAFTLWCSSHLDS
jgi:hypothetical protein